MPGVDVPRARRWFRALLGTAVLATGALHWSLTAPPGPGAAVALLAGGLVAVTASAQAARLLRALNGPPDLDLGRRLDAAGISRGPTSRGRRRGGGAST